MNAKDQILDALSLYEAFHPREARRILLKLTKRTRITDENIHEVCMENLTNPSAAAEGWINLAIDRIDEELGLGKRPLDPVPFCLKTAINLLS